jgi:murein DD-endopeptidase MepM/ murein hydrolase activator NlpD
MKLFFPTKRGYGDISCYWEESKDSPYYKRFNRKHNGIDFGVNEGSDLYAIWDMECYLIEPNKPWGNWCWFKFSDNENSGCGYGHLQTFGTLKIGDKFKRGDLLPIKSGNTGYPTYSSGPHLHLGVWIDGYKNSDMGNYTDALGFFFNNDILEVADTKKNPDFGKKFLVVNNTKSPTDSLTTLLLSETVAGNSTYWLECYKHIKDDMKIDYDYKIVNPGDYIDIKPGESKELVLVLKNTGKKEWIPMKVNIGVTGDKPSRLYNERWIDVNRPCTIPHEVLPGGDVMISIPVTMPLNTHDGETIRIDVCPVVEGLKWMKDSGIFYITTSKK